MFNVFYYFSSRGDRVVETFIQRLDPKTRAKVERVIDLLQELGPNLLRPHADIVSGKIRELRIRFASDHIRILYFFFLKDHIILLHGFRKKTQEIPRKEIEQTERNMTDFVERYQRGEIEL